jgi:hypothetical protein
MTTTQMHVGEYEAAAKRRRGPSVGRERSPTPTRSGSGASGSGSGSARGTPALGSKRGAAPKGPAPAAAAAGGGGRGGGRHGTPPPGAKRKRGGSADATLPPAQATAAACGPLLDGEGLPTLAGIRRALLDSGPVPLNEVNALLARLGAHDKSAAVKQEIKSRMLRVAKVEVVNGTKHIIAQPAP